jgi:hypothetical protein
MYYIYNCWELLRPGESTIAGSLVLDTADTEDKARELMAMYEARHKDFNQQFPIGNENRRTRFVYIHWP